MPTVDTIGPAVDPRDSVVVVRDSLLSAVDATVVDVELLELSASGLAVDNTAANVFVAIDGVVAAIGFAVNDGVVTITAVTMLGKVANDVVD